MGVPKGRIFDVPYTVDNERFIAAAALNPEERAAVRARFGLPPGKPVILYAAKFIARKHPDDVIRAAALLRDEGYDFTVFMVGMGEMDDELRALVRDLGLTNVVFGGFVNQTELPRAYAASDVFVLPSESEAFGLTVNEVMCAGIPVVVSDEVGCVPDLVRDDINGYRIKAGSPAALAGALEKLLRDPAKRAGMGRQSLKIIGDWSYEQCRIGLWKALSSTVPRLKQRPGGKPDFSPDAGSTNG
jgi:glycosyltransferase involved in cell wall biosynthesis